MSQAQQALAKHDAAEALRSQQQAAAALANAAQQAGTQQPPESSGLPTAHQIDQAREIARKLRELDQQVGHAVGQPQPPADAAAKQDAIASQTADLGRSLQQDVSPAAANFARQAESAMQAAKFQQARDSAEARRQRRRAAEDLERAAEEAIRFAEESGSGGTQSSPTGRQAGQSLIKARAQMQAAQKLLQAGSPQQAGGSMKDAAQSLEQAAKDVRDSANQSARGSENAQPGQGATGGPDAPMLPVTEDIAKELERHAGKKWGELPGELRTRIVQDMKAQYGDDYARIIRLYFESLADKK
jgi:hypothetical protein